MISQILGGLLMGSLVIYFLTLMVHLFDRLESYGKREIRPNYRRN
jgi:hypothetical protein